MNILNETSSMVKVGKIHPHPENPRIGNIDAIVESIKVNGFYGALVVQKASGNILAGNHRYLAAIEAGASEVPVIFVDVTDDEATRILLADNRTADLGTYNEQQLVDLLQSLEDTAGTGYNDQELDRLMASLARDVIDPHVDLPDKPKSARGDVFVLGRHRVMCGDSTDPNDVKALVAGEQMAGVFTSPPYAQLRTYEGNMAPDWLELMRAVFADLPLREDAQVFVNLGLTHEKGRVVRYWEPWIDYMAERALTLFGWYVWDKLAGMPGDWNGRLAPAHEWIFHFNQMALRPGKIVKTKYTNADRKGGKGHKTFRQSDGTLRAATGPLTIGQAHKIPDSVIRTPPASGGVGNHPAPFPAELPASFMRAWHIDPWLDPFLGAGSTLVAAEQCDRTCYGMELEPKYLDVTCARFQKLTDTVPVLERTGEEVSFIG